MRICVIGSSAGGGFPQWNCGCANCALARAGSPHVRARTQDSVAVISDGKALLLNASPDVHAQIAASAMLHPRSARHSPIAAIVLTNGDLDHVLGLLSLRESQPLVVYATEAVRAGLFSRNVVFRTLQRFAAQLNVRPLPLDREVEIAGLDGLALTARSFPGKLPVHLEGLVSPSLEDNVALFLRDRRSGRTIVYASAVAALDETSVRLFDGADVLLFDGTFWSSDELVLRGVGSARAEDMAHLRISGATGSLAALATARVARKIYTHINNTNPILVEGSAERRAVEEAGFEVAFDRMEITL